MPDGDQKKNDEFLSLIRSKIENLRPKLLDLSRRNPLLSTRFSTRSNAIVRVVDELPGNVFDDISSGKSMRLSPLPALEDDPKDEQTREFQNALSDARLTDEVYITFLENIDQNSDTYIEDSFRAERDLKDRVRETLNMPVRQTSSDLSLSQHAINNGISPSYELPDPSVLHEDGRHTDADIQTLLLPDILERRMNALMTKCRTWVQETGINVLHIAFGFLEWTEAKVSKTSYSPLVLLPVELKRNKTKDGLEFWINGIGDEAEINTVLAEKLRIDFGIELPELNGNTIESYLKEIAELSPKNLGWRVRRQIAVGVFPSARMAMYHDLDTNSGRYDNHEVIAELFGGTPVQAGESPFGEEYEVDAPHIEKKVPYLVRDADSSQFSAIVDVADGKNLAVEGPPGSGKSQTIVNTIAAALADGKKVLFVAEKMAALDVVKSRLEAVGLGEFLLSLQASRSTKEQVINSLRDRVEMESGEAPYNYESKVAEFRKLRSEISSYIDVIATEHGNTGLTVYDILGKSIATNETLRSLPKQLQSITFKNTEQFTHEKIEEIEEICTHIEEAWATASGADIYWKKSTIVNIDPFITEEILERSKTTAELFQSLLLIRQELPSYRVDEDLPVCQAEDIISIFTNHLSTIEEMNLPLLKRILNNQALSLVKNYIEQCNIIQSEINSLESNLEKPLKSSRIEELKTLTKLVDKISTPGVSYEQIKKTREENENQKINYKAIIEFVGPMVKLLPESKSWSLNSILDACDHIHSTSRETLSLRNNTFSDPSAFTIFQKGLERANQLREKKVELEQNISTNALPSYSDISDHAAIIESSGIFSFLSSDFRRSKRFYVSHSKDKDFDKVRASTKLKELSEWLAEKEKFEKDHQLIGLMGVKYAGLDTDFQAIEKIFNYYKHVDESFSGGDNISLRKFLKDGDLDILLSFPKVELDADIRKNLNSTYSEAEKELKLIDNKLVDFDAIASEIEELSNFIKYKKIANTSWLTKITKELEKTQDSIDSINNNHEIKDILREQFKGFEFESQEIESELKLAESMLATSSENREIIQHSIDDKNYKELHKNLEKLVHLEAESENSINNLSELTGIDTDCFMQENGLLETAEFLEKASEDKEGLIIYSNLHSSIEKLRDHKYDIIIDQLMDSENGFKDFAKIMRSIISRSLAKSVYSSYGDTLAQFNGIKLDDLRSKIAKIDRELINLSKQHLRNKIFNSSYPPMGIGSGRKSTWTEYSLIHNEISKTRRYVPVRDLTKRAGKALIELKPCWMMSPLAVAQYIQQGAIDFDLVIIDEASQMTPEDAVGAILRGKKAMVVGDTNQLPPTSFFHKIFEDEDADEDESVTEESILEMANSAFRPARRLRWHYRSRHSGLIAFSNHHVYNDDLIVFPSASEDAINMGVKLVAVEGRYSSGTNADEAKVMVDQIIKFMRHSPERSLGVVTLNQKQRDLIQEEFEYALKDDIKAARYLDKWDEQNEGLESFFIKNLENVQGDERDVIFIGTVYGPEKIGGPVMQRFGPINGVAGKRRLNVLFSRAKEQIVTFSSMKSSDIKAEEDGNQGVYMLKRWLEYSATGVLHAGSQTNKEPDSDFEIHVIEQLKSIGCEPVPQVGVAGYFIDIGVKHPEWPHGFILGVECDGATYHSSKSARDRDRLRQEVLEGLGWHFHRIWSTDWFSDAQSEVSKLREVVLKRLKYLKENENKFVKPATSKVDASKTKKAVSSTREKQFSSNAKQKSQIISQAKLPNPTPPQNSSNDIDEGAAKIGDKVLVKYLEGTKSEFEITLSDTENIPSKRIVHIDEPLGEAVLGAMEGEDVEVWIGGQKRNAQILKITSTK
ncbi:DUF4011 domain-containing protein [Pseudemcibacter aquimaris]|uniref:DUF4011 domain-containing protein n=1 Tax=Pseudemcibacter aquimaris TaxID=2857064 RepID=UPI0020112863|nr:DUF4011 domain-containing protein [Pseudemcibacter aquimaris]MCC3862607.1 DUF4011 domain-containing protein [Pseudemcibacter aquimaris]WDU57846.1 DUF4011 domain-containing protein [Pseudemcibacter aquimaris]